MDYKNRTGLCGAALQQTGPHAIINWITSNSANPVSFLNNCQPGGNPFLMCTEEQRIELAPRKVLIYNYEDRPLSAAFPPKFLDSKQEWVRESGNSIYVLVLRGPFDNF